MITSTLSSGAKIPVVGLGTLESPKGDVGQAIKYAIEAGYTHFDFAPGYGNEKECGQAFAELFASGKAKREDLFITSKVWNTDHHPDRVLSSCQQTIADLQVGYLDMFLIHWPLTGSYDATGFKGERIPLHVTWGAMEGLVEKKLVRHIGVSNFNALLLFDLLSYAKIRPEMNQIECQPYCQQRDLVKFCELEGIHVTAYCPLVRAGLKKHAKDIFTDPVISAIAAKHKKTNAQVCLRWAVQRAPNVSVIPKSTNKERIVENFQICDFVLDAKDMEEMSGLECGYRAIEPLQYFGIPCFS